MKTLQDETNPNTNASNINNHGDGGAAKKVLLGILALAILAGIYFAATSWSKNSPRSSDYTLKEIDQLQEHEQRKVLQDQLKDAQVKVDSLLTEAETSSRYVAYIRLAELQNRLEKYQEAIASVDKIAADNQGNTRIWTTYATAYKGLGDVTKAKDSIMKAITIDDGLVESWRIYFEVFTDLSNEELDVKYREALNKTNNNIEIVKGYARFLEKTGDKTKAIIYWETARNVDPNNAGEYEKEISRLRA